MYYCNVCGSVLGNRVKNLAKVCVKPTKSTDYGSKNLRRIRNSILPVGRTNWPIDINFPLETIPETPMTGCPPSAVLLETKGGTIHDAIRSQQMECRTQKRFKKVSHIVNTYVDDIVEEDMDIDTDINTSHDPDLSMQDVQSWDGDGYDEAMLCPPPDYDTDAGSD